MPPRLKNTPKRAHKPPPAIDFVVPEVYVKRKKFKGDHILNFPNFVIYVMAKRRKGKTCFLYNCIRWFADPTTTVIIFSRSAKTDPTYKSCLKYMESKKIPFMTRPGIKETPGPGRGNGLHYLYELMELMKEEVEEYRRKEEERDEARKRARRRKDINAPVQDDAMVGHLQFGFNGDVRGSQLPGIESPIQWVTNQEFKNFEREVFNMGPPEKHERLGPEPRFLILIDDEGKSMRDETLLRCIKNSAHINATVIVASQGLFDMFGDCVGQISYMTLFSKTPKKRLDSILDELALDIWPEQFYEIYEKYTNPDIDAKGKIDPNTTHKFIILDAVDGKIRAGIDPKDTVYSEDQKWSEEERNRRILAKKASRKLRREVNAPKDSTSELPDIPATPTTTTTRKRKRTQS